MMRYSSPWLLVCGLAAGLLVAACREKEAAATPTMAPPTQGVEGFYDPQPAESWTYAGTRDFPPEARFGPDDEERILDLPEGAQRLEFERRRVCTGRYRPEGSDRELTTFEIYEDDTLLERELYDITCEGVIGRGWTPAEIPLAEAVLVTPGFKIATPDMAGGQSWNVPSEDPDRSIQLDVIERAEIEVPAGTFEAARLRITVTGNQRTTIRTVWFAENIGIVKEEVVHYDADRINVRERLELVGWTLPALAGQDHPLPAPPSLSDPNRFTPVSTAALAPSDPDEEPSETKLVEHPYEGALSLPPGKSDELLEHPYEGALSFPPEESEESPGEHTTKSGGDDAELTIRPTSPAGDNAPERQQVAAE